MANNSSVIALVGAGPGDPDLLTLKAYKLIQQADVIVYDRLVSQPILDMIPHGTQRIYVGKASGQHHMGQDEINQLLVKLAQTQKQVVRLKGGDPFIFGRGSEEAQYLIQHGIDFEYVPGITAASACSAYAGIPLTHRGVATSVRLITGHCRADHPLDLNWQSLAEPNTTLVFYMGLANLSQLKNELIKAGLPADTPAAAIENGTTTTQRRCLSKLSQLPDDIEAMAIQSPALIIIGNVVNFADELNWFTPQHAENPLDKIASKG